jgi:putative phage-type endonuclease
MMEQRSPEWFAARLGKVGASRICDVMARTRSGYGASRANYLAELVCERLTGVCAESYMNAAMQWGIDQEAAARAAYCFITDCDVEPCGFFDHPTVLMSGASPDGIIGNDGLLEIKCPNSHGHIETLLTGVIDGKYILQMQWQMACTSRAWADFVSFDPRLPAEMQLWVKRVARDDNVIAEIESEVRKFLAELDEKVAALRSRYGGDPFVSPLKAQLEASLA